MNRSLLLVATATTFILAACGGVASAAKSSTSPSPGAGNALRNGASGQLVQISGQTLILTGPNGDITVMFTTATMFTKTSVATLADITPGACVLATGRKDATTGAITATNVRISPKTSAGCAAAGFAPGGAAGASPRPSVSPRAGATPRPTPSGLPNAAFVTGEVTAVTGTSVTVLTQATGSQTITVQAAATVTLSAVVSQSNLQNGQCLRANGSRDSTGNVLATAITITPAGPSGTCTSGLGGGGRGGGARGGGGAPPSGGVAGG
jgi:hypothetical protein